VDKSDVMGALGLEADTWLWCVHCQRCFRAEDYKLGLDGCQYCPYEGCDGRTVTDGRRWDEVREVRPEYPEIPTWAVTYPLHCVTKATRSRECRGLAKRGETLGVIQRKDRGRTKRLERVPGG
jgi:hypothetical protein